MGVQPNMTRVSIKRKLGGMFPPRDHWSNSKGHISALVKGGKVCAYGESSLGGRPCCASFRGRSCHSEMSVLKYIQSNKFHDKRKIRKYTIWNIRWTKQGQIMNSKPCVHCQKVLLHIGINKIVFSTDHGYFIKTTLASLTCQLSSGYRY